MPDSLTGNCEEDGKRYMRRGRFEEKTGTVALFIEGGPL